EHELKRIRAVSATALVATAIAIAFAIRARDAIAFREVLVARQHAIEIAIARLVAERGLGDVLGRDVDHPALLHIAYRALRHHAIDRFADVLFVAPYEALAVNRAAAFRVDAAINERRHRVAPL